MFVLINVTRNINVFIQCLYMSITLINMFIQYTIDASNIKFFTNCAIIKVDFVNHKFFVWSFNFNKYYYISIKELYK